MSCSHGFGNARCPGRRGHHGRRDTRHGRPCSRHDGLPGSHRDRRGPGRAAATGLVAVNVFFAETARGPSMVSISTSSIVWVWGALLAVPRHPALGASTSNFSKGRRRPMPPRKGDLLLCIRRSPCPSVWVGNRRGC